MDKALQIILSKTFLKSRKNIPESYQVSIDEALEAISINPFNAPQIKKLSGYDSYYRYRVGNYRIVYDVQKTVQIINVMDIVDRKDAY